MSTVDKTNRINQFRDAYQNSREGYTLFKSPSGSLEKLFKTHLIDIAPSNELGAILGLHGEQNKDIWANAAQLLFDLYEYYGHEADIGFIRERISEKTSDLNIYNPLWYLTDETEKEISEFMHAFSYTSINKACESWVRKEIEKVANILNDWVHAKD